MTQMDLLLPRVQAKVARTMDAFLRELQEENGWVKGSTLAYRLHTSDRVVRMCAERSQGRIISGQLGYKLISTATNDEIDHAEAWLISQGRKMLDRAREIRVARNRGVAA